MLLTVVLALGSRPLSFSSLNRTGDFEWTEDRLNRGTFSPSPGGVDHVPPSDRLCHV